MNRDKTTAPIAVYGALRSGTTMLRLMLDAHPKLHCPSETDFIFDALVREKGGFRCDEGVLERDRIYRNYRMRHGAPSDLSPTGFVQQMGAAEQTGILMLHRQLDRVLDVFPDMRFIHFLRDPRDVARSSIGMGWAGTVYHGIGHWMETEGDWNRLAARIPAEQILRISYEDLILAPEDRLRAICAFCGVDFDPAMLEYDRDSTYEKPDPSLTFQWKRKQTRREIELVETRIGPLLAVSGYEAAYPEASGPGGLEKATLSLRNKRATWARRIERYGLRDPLIVAICNRLGYPALSAKAERRMDDRLQAYLK